MRPLQRTLRLLTFSILSWSLITSLSGCATTSEQEQKNDPQVILEQAKQAYNQQKYKTAFQLLFPLAAAGNDKAQYALGYLYYHGLGVEKNDQQAMNWIQRAAAKGNKKALEALR